MQRVHLFLAFFLPMLGLIGCGSSTPQVEIKITSLPPTQPSPMPTAAVSSSLNCLSPALKMNAEHAAHTATLLPNGKVLIAGGFREEGTSEIAIASAEIFDPGTNTFTPTSDMNEPRDGHTATLLPDGQVLIVGGWNQSSRSSTAELYDPQTGTFAYTGSLMAPRQGMTATLLKNGRVLIAGGDSARRSSQLTAELYDPETKTFSPAGILNRGWMAHTATLLSDGRVLFVGGASGNEKVLASAEIYDVKTGAFRQISAMNRKRFKLADAAVLLADGNVLIGGGNRQLEVFDSQSRSFLQAGTLDDDYYYSVLTPLQNGQVLITGGYNGNILPSDKAWLYCG